MKIIHLPTSIGGNSWGLSQGERRIGLDSTVLVCGSNYIKYKADQVVLFPEKGMLRKPRAFFRLFRKFLNIRNTYDVFHFNFGTSLLDFPNYGLYLSELPLYPKDAKLLVTYNGCDARQKFPTIARTEISPCHEDMCYEGMCNSGMMDKVRKRKIEKFSRHVHHIFALNPDLLWFLPEKKASFLPYTTSGWFDCNSVKSVGKSNVLNIVHAPTNRVCKGTDIILKALHDLQSVFKGYVNIILVENTSHEEAMKIYQQADLVVDQVLVGWYGGFAVEVMKMGKPVAVYIREEDLQFIPDAMAKDIEDAFIKVTKYNIFKVLSHFVEDRRKLQEKAKNSLQYVLKWHDPQKIALKVKKYYDS